MGSLIIYFDYTCGDSYRAKKWVDRLDADRHRVQWRTYSLKESRRRDEEPSHFDSRSPISVSVLALALAHAARPTKFDHYHDTVFRLMHEAHQILDEQALLEIARGAGVDIQTFNRDRDVWRERVALEHTQGVEQWGAIGTPVVVVDDRAAFYLELFEPPADGREAEEILESLTQVAARPRIREIRRTG